MSLVQVSVYSPTGAFIAHVPRRRGLTWGDEQNTAQPASMEIPLRDAVLTRCPDLLNRRNIVVFAQAGQKPYGWQITSLAPVRVSQDGQQWVKVSGIDVLNVLNAAKVAPANGILAANTRDVRYFDAFSPVGDWYVSADWVAPKGVEQGSSTAWPGLPAKWPPLLKHAKWLWDTDPQDPTNPIGWRYFRSNDFTVPSDMLVHVYASADNIMDLRVNGISVYQSKNVFQFKSTLVFPVRLSAGPNNIGAAVYNAGGPAGFLAAVTQVDSKGNPTSALYQSLVGNTKVHDDTPKPGHARAHVMSQLISEAQDRGVHELLPVVLGYTPTADSDGHAWTDRTTRTEQVEVTLVDEVAAKFCEDYLDQAMTPDTTDPAQLVLRYDLWKSRGVDRRSTVRLVAGLTSSAPTIDAAKVRTDVSVRFANGWAQFEHANAATLRREIGLSTGNLLDAADAADAADAYFDETAEEEVTIPVTIESGVGPQPGLDFDLGDLVETLGPMTGLVDVRVMSWTAAEQNGKVTYQVTCYPVT